MQQRYKIKSWQEFADNIDSIDDDTLLVCDIDDTLLQPDTWIGSTEWFDWQCNLLQNEPMSKYLVASSFKKLIKILYQLYQNIKMVPCESSIVEQNILHKFDTIFLTARDACTHDITETHLKSHFTWTAPHIEAFQNKIPGTKFINGIGYTSGQNKGELLFHILKHLPKYKRVIFVDDKLDNIIAVENIMSGMELTSFLYSFSSRRRKEFQKISPDTLNIDFNKLFKSENV